MVWKQCWNIPQIFILQPDMKSDRTFVLHDTWSKKSPAKVLLKNCQPENPTPVEGRGGSNRHKLPRWGEIGVEKNYLAIYKAIL